GSAVVAGAFAAQERRRQAVAAVETCAGVSRRGGLVTSHLPFRPIMGSMNARWNRDAQAALLSLEADAASARGGFACLFSTSDEYESALITERRAQGRYGRTHTPWPLFAFAGCALLIALVALLSG